MKIAISAAAIGLCLAANQSWAGKVEFDGRFHLTAQNATCISFNDGILPVDFRYRPPNLGTNGATTSLSLLEGPDAENWTLASGSLIGTAYKTVTATGIGPNAGQMTTKIRISSQVPATLSATTPSVTITGDIRNFQEDAGCNISFIATGYLK